MEALLRKVNKVYAKKTRKADCGEVFSKGIKVCFFKSFDLAGATKTFFPNFF